MKIALLCYDQTRATFMAGLEKGLKERGHEVKLFHHEDEGKNPGHVKTKWVDFEIKAIDYFNPDRLIIFNGYASQSSGVTAYLKTKYSTLFMEQAWLPQANNVYLDHEGLGGRSWLAKQDLAASNLPINEDAVANIKKHFDPGANPLPSFGDYILVPMQVEHDTQIVLDSPYFKTMRSLVDYVLHHFPDFRVVVKLHPRSTQTLSQRKTEHIVGPDITMNRLAAYARAIIGINSTSLVEALVHEKPIISLGNSILSGSRVFLTGEAALAAPRRVLEHRPSTEAYKRVLTQLLSRQFNKNEPTDFAYQQITGA